MNFIFDATISRLDTIISTNFRSWNKKMNKKESIKMFKETIHSNVFLKKIILKFKMCLLKPNMQIESFTTGLLILSPLTHFNLVCSVYLVAAAKHCKFECKKKVISRIYFSYFPALNIQQLQTNFATAKSVPLLLLYSILT